MQATGPPTVNLAKGELTVDFPLAFHDAYSVSTSGQIEGFTAEIGANGFQFQAVDSIRITIAGDCGTFWGGTAYGACRTLFRDGLR